MRALRLLLIFLPILWSSIALAQYKLGNSKIPIIEKMTEQYKGKSLSLRQLDQIVREISQDGLFQEVFVEEVSSGNVIIRAAQSSKIKDIKVTGNNSYSSEEIVALSGIKAGSIMSDLEIKQAINKIKKDYEKSGFYNFRISYKKIPKEAGYTLSIKIEEQDYCFIRDIKVFSKNDWLNKELIIALEPFLFTSFKQDTSNEIQKAINSFLLENRFLTSKVERSGTIFNPDKTQVKLTFTISNPTQYEFVFYGNEFFSHFNLVQTAKIGQKFLYLSDSTSEIVESISKFYLKSGFPKFKINHDTQYFAEKQKKVIVFDINEGPRIRIGKINVIGKISRDRSYYASLFKKFLAEQAHSVYFVKEDVQAAAETMVTELKREGYLMAELLSVTSDFTPYNNANINIQIDEGILTYVRQILFRGSKSFSNIELKDQVGIEPNKPLRMKQVEDSFEKLETFYKNRAFLEFKIKNRNATVIQYKPGQPYADIVFQISEGPKIRVKAIQVTGNVRTENHVPMREVDFKVGDLLTLERVTNSIDRLERTGLFGKVNIRTLEQGSTQSERTIIIEVEERKPGLFSAGVGIQDQGQRLITRGYVGMLYNNLWGKARALSGRADVQYDPSVDYLENRIALAYYEPYLSTDRLRGRFSLIRDLRWNGDRVNDTVNNESDVALIAENNEFRFSVEREVSRHFRFTYNVWSFTDREIFQVNTLQPQQKIEIGTTGPIFELDYRNDLFLPTSGSYYRLDLEYSSPLLQSSEENPGASGTTIHPISGLPVQADPQNEIQYIKANFSSSYYTPLTRNRKWVWANSLRGGFAENLSHREDSGIPKVRGFFLGGQNTIRGFNTGAIETIPGKRELCLKQNLINNTQQTGDCSFDDVFIREQQAYFLIKSELRFPISGELKGHVFYDGGGVYLTEFSLEDPYRDSVGAGIRYDTAVGSLVFEMGYKLDAKKNGGPGAFFDTEDDYAIHLSIGTF